MCGECLNLIAVRAFIYHQSRLIIIERWSHSQLGSISSSSVQRMAQTHRFQTHLAHTFSSDRSVLLWKHTCARFVKIKGYIKSSSLCKRRRLWLDTKSHVNRRLLWSSTIVFRLTFPGMEEAVACRVVVALGQCPSSSSHNHSFDPCWGCPRKFFFKAKLIASHEYYFVRVFSSGGTSLML